MSPVVRERSSGARERPLTAPPSRAPWRAGEAPLLVLGGPRSEKVRRPLAAVGTPMVFYRRHAGIGVTRAIVRLVGGRPRAVLVDGSGYQALVGWLLGVALRRPFIVRLRGDIWTEAAESMRFLRGVRRVAKLVKFRLGDFAIRRAAGVICVSRHLQAVVARRAPHLEGRLVCVPTPIDERYVAGDPRNDSPCATALALGPEQRVVLTVTTFDYLQKAGSIERYAPEVAGFLRRHDDVVWIVAGAGAHLDAIRRRLEAVAPPGRIRVTGFVPDVRPLYRRALFFLYFSCLDALPSVVQEAKAFGLPVVVNDEAGLPELVVDGRDGYVVPAGDGTGLRDRMEALYADAALRATLGENAKRDALDRFRDATIGEALMGAIEALAKPGATRKAEGRT